MNSLKYLTMVGAGLAALAAAQDSQPQHMTVPFRDASGPRKLEVNLMTAANVTVRGAARTDVAIDYTVRGTAGPHRSAEPPPPGMHRIGGSSTLNVTQDNNVVRVDGGGIFGRLGDVDIQVPAQTSVRIATTLGGKVVVENISGEIEVNHLNGDITITNASGPVVAHSMNGKIIASLNNVAPDKNMSFSTFNGDIDVTLPADAKATLKATADNGDIFTDFDVKLLPQTAAGGGAGLLPAPPPPAPAPLPGPAPQPAPLVAPGVNKSAIKEQIKAAMKRDRDRDRKHVRRGDGYVEGTINGGGPEIQFTTFNGRILIHKK